MNDEASYICNTCGEEIVGVDVVMSLCLPR